MMDDPFQQQHVEEHIITTIHHCRNDDHFAEFLFEIFLYEMAGAIPHTKTSATVRFEQFQLAADVARSIMLSYGDDPGVSEHAPALLFDLFIATAPYAPSPMHVYAYLLDQWRVKRLFMRDVGMDQSHKLSPSHYPLSCTVPKLSQADHDHFQRQYAKIRPQFQDRYAAIVHACRKFVWRNQGSGGVSVRVHGVWSVEKYTNKYNGEILKKLDIVSSYVVERQGHELPSPPSPLSSEVDPNAGGEAAKSKSALKRAAKKKAREEVEASSSTAIDTPTASSSSQLPMATSASAAVTKTSSTPTPTSPPSPIKDTINARPVSAKDLLERALERGTVLGGAMNDFSVAELKRRKAVEAARQRAIVAAKEREVAEASMESRLRRLCRRGIEINEAQDVIRERVEKAMNKARTKARGGKTTPAASVKEFAKKPVITGASSTSVLTSITAAANSGNGSSSNGTTQTQQQSDKELAREITVKYQELDFFLDEFARLATLEDVPESNRITVVNYLRCLAKEEIESHWDAHTQPLMPVLVQYLHSLVRARNISSKTSVQLLKSMRETTLEEKLKRSPLGFNVYNAHGSLSHLRDTYSDSNRPSYRNYCGGDDDDNAFGQDLEDSKGDDYGVLSQKQAQEYQELDSDPESISEDYDEMSLEEMSRAVKDKIAMERSYKEFGPIAWSAYCRREKERMEHVKNLRRVQDCTRKEEEEEAKEAQRVAEEEKAARTAKEKAARIAKEETERKEAERRAKEALRLAQEKADRLAKEKADKLAKEKADRLAKEEADRRSKEEAERRAKAEADRRAKAEAERRAKEEAELKARQEVQRKAREEAERRAKEEAELKARQEIQRKAREEAERRAKEEAEQRAKKNSEQLAKEEAQRIAQEKVDREETERLDKLHAKEEEERRAKNDEAWAAATAAVAKGKRKKSKASPQAESRPYTIEELEGIALESMRNISRGKTKAEMDLITKEMLRDVDLARQEHRKVVQTKLEGENRIKSKALAKAAAKTAKAAAEAMAERAERERQEERKIKAWIESFKDDRVQEILEMREEVKAAEDSSQKPKSWAAWAAWVARDTYDPDRKMIERTERYKRDRYLEIEAMRREAKDAVSVANPPSITSELPAPPSSPDESGTKEDSEDLENLENLEYLEVLTAQVESSLSALETVERRLRAQMQVAKERGIMEEKVAQGKVLVQEMMRQKQEAEKKALALAKSRSEPVRLPNNGTVYFDCQGINFGLSLWKLPAERFQAMEIILDKWYLDLLPTQSSMNLRRDFLSRLQTIFDVGFPGRGLELRPFGSFVTGLGNDWSDIDICIFSKNYLPYAVHSNVSHLAKFLRSKDMKRVVAIPDAKVPIIKFVDPITGIACDMNVQHPLGVNNSYLIGAYLDIDSRLGVFLHLLKCFASSHGILDGASGFLCSYAYNLMAIVFFQEQNDAILPRLQVKDERPRSYDAQGKSRKRMATFANSKMDGSVATIISNQDGKAYDCSFDTRIGYYTSYGITNKKTVAQLLFEFFEFFARKFDYRTMEVSTALGKVQERQSLQKEKRQQMASEKLLGSAGAAIAVKTANSTNMYSYDSKRRLWLSAAEQVYFKDMDANCGVPSGAVPVPGSTDTNGGATTSRGGYQDKLGSEASLYVMDPFVLDRNVAGTCRGERLAKVWRCFDYAYKCLALGKFREAFEPIPGEQ
ncbi:hypothetical protein BGZ58_007928 [Dissophora ornata]|nr:hypothetical protein BGZ58_007928 [Dissophora ornata]